MEMMPEAEEPVPSSEAPRSPALLIIFSFSR